MNFMDLQDIIQFAIEKEKEAAQFYEDVSKEENLSGSREMLMEFSREEQKHWVMLKKLSEEGIVEGLDDYKFKWIVDIKRSDYVAEMEYTPGMAYNDLLMLAMKREEKALALYNKLQREADTPESKKLFKMLCQEEAKHKLALETLYDDYMAEMGD